MQIWQQAQMRTGGENVATVDLMEIVKHYGIVNVRMITDKNGIERVHLLDKDNKYQTLRVSDGLAAVIPADKKGMDRFRWIVDNSKVYFGIGDVPNPQTGALEKKVWFTFGVAGSVGETETFSLADVFAKAGAVVAG